MLQYAKFYYILVRIGRFLQPFVLLGIRLLWGFLFLKAGLGKLMDPGTTAAFFEKINIPLPYFNAILVGLVELIGGSFLMVGLVTRLIAIPLIILLLVAYSTAHSDVFHAADVMDSVMKAGPFSFLLACIILFAFGPGPFSLDRLFEHWHLRSEKYK